MNTASRLALLCLLGAPAAMAADNQAPVPQRSPFTPPPPTAGAGAASNENLELAGVSMMGDKTDLVLYDKGAKRSLWIGVGQSKEGIAVVRYDAQREQAVVKINGAEKVLTMRKGTGPVNAPAAIAPLPTGFNVATPLPAPATPAALSADATNAASPAAGAAPAQPATPMTPQAKAEMDARMLVSDLLEIGMIQRKAYEDAQRKAAQGQAQQSQQNTTATADTPPANASQNR